MKTHLHVTILALAALGCADAYAAAPALRAGAAAVDITPREFPVNLVGGWEADPATSAHDPLHARALAFADGSVTVAVVVVDNLHVAQEVCDEARTNAAARCGVPPERVMVASTHAHSCPSSNVRQGPAPEVAYRKVLVEGISESIVRAVSALRPAEIGAGAKPLPDEVFNRRWFLKPGKMTLNPFGKMDQVKMNPSTSPDVLDRPAGPTDPDVTVLDVREAGGGKALALLACYSLHYVGGIPRGQASADYYGEFCRILPSRLDADGGFVALMANGTSGNINNIPFMVGRPRREPFEQIGIVAGKVADTACAARKEIAAHRGDVRLGAAWREITLKLRLPTEEQIAWAKGIQALTDPAEKAKLPPHAETYSRRVLGLAGGPQTERIPLQVVRLGDIAFCAIPFEPFVEIGMDLKKRSPFATTFVLGNANGTHGYLPTPEQHKLGGYETWLGSSRVQEDASVLISDQLLDMLRELKQAGDQK